MWRRVIDPFTLEHFRWWASDLILDNGERWVLQPFQEEFAEDVFGSTASRRESLEGVKEAWLVVPEGNGKSTLLAGIALYHCEFWPDAMVPVAASSRDQAKIIYRQAKGFVRRTLRLEHAFRCYDGYRRITHVANDSQIEVFAADDRTGDGIIPTMPLVDELHRHKSMDLYLTWLGKLDKRGAQMLVISTAGEPGSEFEEARERFRQTAEVMDRRPGFVRAAADDWVLHDWAIAEDGDSTDVVQVKEANPFSGVTLDTLERKRLSPTMTPQHWRRFVCNLPTRSDRAAIQESEWFGAVTAERPPLGEPVWLGLDVAWKWDTTAAVPLWWRDSTFRVFLKPEILVPPRDGTSLDPHAVEGALVRLHERNPIHTVVMDQHRAEQLAAWIEAELGALVVDRSQTNKFAADDYVKFMEALREGWLKHCGDRELSRHALNAIARVLPQGDARFDRPHQSRLGGDQDRRVIDGLTASAMVHAVAAANSGPEWPLYTSLT